jgi:exodeoxyribonuclease V alpha subunit
VASPAPSSLTGVLERIIFFNEENHYTIAEFRPEAQGTDDPAAKVTIVGALPGVECGETLHLQGEWTKHAQHGAQFKIAGFKSELPASVYGIRKYLGSGLVPGIGKVYANKIVDAFGTDTFRVLSEESGRLRDVEGIGKKRATAIKEAWDSKRTERELYIFLQTYGVTPSQCVKLVHRFGADAKRILTTEPYRVAREIDGIGFKTADRIAINLGFANDAPPRLDAGLLYALETLQEEGHTAFREADLCDYSSQLLETDSKLVEARIAALVQARSLVRHWPAGDAPSPAPHHGEGAAAPTHSPLPGSGRSSSRTTTAPSKRSPTVVAGTRKVASGLPPIKVDAAVTVGRAKSRLRLPRTAAHRRQKRPHQQALRPHRRAWHRQDHDPPRPRRNPEGQESPRAPRRPHRPRRATPQPKPPAASPPPSTACSNTTPPSGGFVANENAPLATDFLVVDEASMLDTRLASALLQAVPSRAHLLLVGDTDQLPSVGAGNVLKDLIAASESLGGRGRSPSGPLQSASRPGLLGDQALPTASSLVPVTRLSVIYRQQGQSQIVTTAHAINAGDPSLPPVVPEVSPTPSPGPTSTSSPPPTRGLRAQGHPALHRVHPAELEVAAPDQRRAGARPDAQGRRRRRQPQRPAPGRAQPRPARGHCALPPANTAPATRSSSSATTTTKTSSTATSAPSPGSTARTGTLDRRLRRRTPHLRPRRTGRPRPRLRHQHPQVTGQ